MRPPGEASPFQGLLSSLQGGLVGSSGRARGELGKAQILNLEVSVTFIRDYDFIRDFIRDYISALSFAPFLGKQM